MCVWILAFAEFLKYCQILLRLCTVLLMFREYVRNVGTSIYHPFGVFLPYPVSLIFCVI